MVVCTNQLSQVAYDDRRKTRDMPGLLQNKFKNAPS